jgi:hypothetical protein
LAFTRLKRRVMCEKCVEIDEKTERCRSIASHITDQATLDGIKELIGGCRLRRTYFTRSKRSRAASVGGLF